MKEKVILAYSGGLDTTAIIPWLKENFDYDVVIFKISDKNSITHEIKIDLSNSTSNSLRGSLLNLPDSQTTI